ncbi:hypothetical protein J2128_002131 [Methanomicrobium sp. W14]|uniref:hypothetical protein n=1 Tax=Methanomicrobium sp. W14 TaxID=2817839 RepID=UPI001AEB8DB9|nr:hypothetical protein [Methanomicrobium sp. W14]MBP2134165.1 hypothetical protein [Methanomicrobium sp. W14]
MNEKQEFILGCIVLVIAIMIIPVSIAVFMHGSSPYSEMENDPVVEAAELAGLSICSVNDSVWDIPGAEGGKTYTFSGNCTDPDERLVVYTQAFNSSASRDAAILSFNSRVIGKLKNPGVPIVVGQYLVYVDDSRGKELSSRIADALDKIENSLDEQFGQ